MYRFIHSCFQAFDNNIAATLLRLLVLSFACYDLLVFFLCLTDYLYHSTDLRLIQSATFVSVSHLITQRDVRPGASSVYLFNLLFSKRPFDLFYPLGIIVVMC